MYRCKHSRHAYHAMRSALHMLLCRSFQDVKRPAYLVLIKKHLKLLFHSLSQFSSQRKTYMVLGIFILRTKDWNQIQFGTCFWQWHPKIPKTKCFCLEFEPITWSSAPLSNITRQLKCCLINFIHVSKILFCSSWTKVTHTKLAKTE